MRDMIGQYIQKKEEEKQIKEEQAAKVRYWKIHVCDDDDNDDYTITITPKEPDNSLRLPEFEDSFSCFLLSITRSSLPQLHFGNPYPNLID
nr:hypothetical protein [Tanacetum cinerariifolium]